MFIPQIPEGDRLDDRLSDRLIRARRAHAPVLSLLNIAAATFPDRLSDLVKPFVGTGIREGGPNADYRPGTAADWRADIPLRHSYDVMVRPVSISYAIEITFAGERDRAERRVPKEKIMTKSKQAEPPSRERPPVLMVGQDCRGNWVVQEQSGNCGGLFASRDAALRYVRDENRNHQRSVVMISGSLELDVNRRMCVAIERLSATDGQRLRRVA